MAAPTAPPWIFRSGEKGPQRRRGAFSERAQSVLRACSICFFHLCIHHRDRLILSVCCRGLLRSGRGFFLEQPLLLEPFESARTIAPELHGAASQNHFDVVDELLGRPNRQILAELKQDFLRLI